MKKEEIDRLNQELRNYSLAEFLRYFVTKYKGRIALASNFSIEDQTITHGLVSFDKTVKVFTLDTEKLFTESVELIEKSNSFFGIEIEVMRPDKSDIEAAFEGRKFESIYEKIEYRKNCCNARKVIPLKKALSGLDCWITGQRRSQSETRVQLELVEWDESNGIVKINPLTHWSEEEVWQYIYKYDIPYNSLQKKGYPSLGCEPCTRAIEPGEDIRAGRWYWENPDTRECGLHVKK